MSEPSPILLVEDNDNDAQLTLTALTRNHLANRVVRCQDGAEALDYLRRQGAWSERPAGNPVVILLDIKMPKVGGIEVLRQVRTDPALRLIPAVMLTSSREEGDLDATYRLGANAYVVKPVEFHAFVDAVRQIGSFWAVVNEPPP